MRQVRDQRVFDFLSAGVVAVLLWLGVNEVAQAHLTGTCLLRLADAAEAEQRCLAGMTAPGQCKADSEYLQAAVQECRDQVYIPADIEHAMAHGRERVGGGLDTSPYQQGLKRAARQQQLLEANNAHFQAYFGLDKQHYSEMLDDYFDEAACPNAFRGVNGRYKMVGTRVLQRLPVDRDHPPIDNKVTWQFFEALKPDVCVAAPKGSDKSAWGALAIVNIPRDLLLELAADRTHNKIYLCVTQQDCQSQLDRINDAWQHYADHVQILHRLEDCSVGSALAKGIHFTKAAQAPIHDSDVFCQQGELDTLELNERKYLQELEAAMFEHGRVQ